MISLQDSPLNLATVEDVKDIERVFRSYKGVFPYIRRDYLERNAAAGHIFTGFDTIAIIAQTKRAGRMGTFRYEKGFWRIHELVSSNRENATGPMQFFRTFCRDVVEQGTLYNEIRDENETSIKWHLAMGFERVGDISWKEGTIPGGVYRFEVGKRASLL